MDCKIIESDVKSGLRCPVCTQYWEQVCQLGGRVYGFCKMDSITRSAKAGSVHADAMLANNLDYVPHCDGVRQLAVINGQIKVGARRMSQTKRRVE